MMTGRTRDDAGRINRLAWVLGLTLAFCGIATPNASAAMYDVGTPPKFASAAIKIGGQVPQGLGQAIVMVEKSTITLSADTVDMDNMTDGKVTTPVADEAWVIWKAASGKVSVDRIKTGGKITYTAPGLCPSIWPEPPGAGPGLRGWPGSFRGGAG